MSNFKQFLPREVNKIICCLNTTRSRHTTPYSMKHTYRNQNSTTGVEKLMSHAHGKQLFKGTIHHLSYKVFIHLIVGTHTPPWVNKEPGWGSLSNQHCYLVVFVFQVHTSCIPRKQPGGPGNQVQLCMRMTVSGHTAPRQHKRETSGKYTGQPGAAVFT